LKACKAKRNAIETKRLAITGPLNKAMKAVNDLFRGPLEALDGAEAVFKQSMIAYSDKKAAQAKAEQDRLDELARIERERIEAEARAVAEAAAQKQREADAAAQAEADRLAAEAAAARAAGDAEAARKAEERAAADRIEQQRQAEANARETAAQVAAVHAVAAVTIAPTVAAAAPKAAGVSTSTTADFEVQDLVKLVKHIAEHPELINLVCANDVKLRAYVKGVGLQCTLPGVRVFEKKTLASRSR